MMNKKFLKLVLLSVFLSSGAFAQEDSCRNVSMSDSAVTVMDAYVAYYGRPADAAGLEWWADKLTDEGGNLASIIDAFGNSDEFTRRFDGLSNTDLVTNIYGQLFNRSPDEGGLAFYVGELEAGNRTLQTIALDVLYGAQGDDILILDNKRAVAYDYLIVSQEEGRNLLDTELADLLAPVSAEASSAAAVCAMQGYLLREEFCELAGNDSIILFGQEFTVYTQSIVDQGDDCLNYAVTATCNDDREITGMPEGASLDCVTSDEPPEPPEPPVTEATACEYTQVTPGGSFEVCQDEQTENSCAALNGTFSARSCDDGSAVGYCDTDDGNIYYFEGDPAFLEVGCGFLAGEWVTL